MPNVQNGGIPVPRKNPVRQMFIALFAGVLCIFSLGAWADQDVVLVLDNSNSMHANAQAIAQAMTDFANSRGPDTRIAVIVYAKTPALQVPLTPINGASRQQISDALRRLDYHGQLSDTAAGVEQALAEIVNHGESSAQKSIILITDDFENLGNAATNENDIRWTMRSLVPTALYNHVRIYGITFASGVVYKTLEALTQRTGGSVFYVAHDSDLPGVFQRISASMLNTGMASMPSPPGKVVPLAFPPAIAGSAIPAQFNTPLTRKNVQLTHAHWLWLIGLLALIAAFFGIYAAWNIMRHIQFPRKLMQPVASYAEGPRAVLYDISDSNDIKRFELAERSTLLGRVAGYDPEVQYVLVKEKTVGRCHAVIERRGHSFWIMDQGSINGTFVNGERITADRALKHGDIVAIHRHEFEFMIPEYFESESTVVGAREQLAG